MSEIELKLINEFNNSLSGWDWETWCATGARDKEEIVAEAVVELGVQVDITDAYELFWDWADGLTEEDFGD